MSMVSQFKKIRIQKVLADRGLCSRRQAETWIEKGFVFLNGEPVTKQGVLVDPSKDSIDIANHLKNKTFLYLKYYKPRGVLTHSRIGGAKCIPDLLPSKFKSLKAIGRLDKDSEGLILLTDDRVFIKSCLAPQKYFSKTYEVTLSKPLLDKHIDRLRYGMVLNQERLRPVIVKKITGSRFLFVLTQGKNRQIRKLMSRFNIQVESLKRIAYGDISLEPLNSGEWSFFEPKHVFSNRD